MKAEEKWNGIVIEVLDKEHGKKVIEWWKGQGVDTYLIGSETKEKNSTYRYYGILGGEFDAHKLSAVKTHNAKIITLPEPFPEKWYMVCDESNQEVANEWLKNIGSYYYENILGNAFCSKNYNGEHWFGYGGRAIDYMSKDYPDYQEITFEQFKEHVLKQPKQSNKMKIKPEQAQEIIDIVSPTCRWKERLLDLWAKSIVLKQEIDVDDSLYKEGYKDASESQKRVLDGIFGKSKEVNLKDGVSGYSLFDKDRGQNTTMIGIRCGREYKDKAFALSCDFDWEIKKDSKNVLCLIPTNK